LSDRLKDFDIIITCTASTLPILGKGMLERVVKQRRHAPVFIVDLAVPRDIEPEAAELDDIFLYSIDDLVGIVKDNLQVRHEAVAHAEQMIADQTNHFLRWLEGRSMVPTIEALHGHHDEFDPPSWTVRASCWPGAAPDKVEALARGLTNKFLHAPLAALNAAGDTERAELIAALQRVWQLDQPGGDEH
jgi:glutamyl-tRNA reductase